MMKKGLIFAAGVVVGGTFVTIAIPYMVAVVVATKGDVCKVRYKEPGSKVVSQNDYLVYGTDRVKIMVLKEEEGSNETESTEACEDSTPDSREQ